MTPNSQSIAGNPDAEDSARQSLGGGPSKRLPPPWLIGLVRTIVACVCSSVLAVVIATWNVRGYYDQIDTHMRIHDVQIESLDKKVDRGFSEVREDLRDERNKDHSH